MQPWRPANEGDRPLALGRFPTPVEHLVALSAPGADLWVKRDDLSHPVYGGNKVRKLERLLRIVPRGETVSGAARVVTAGAIGSHHVLATAYFGRSLGIEVEAVVFPQPRTDHVVDVLRADLALGVRMFPVDHVGAAPFAVVRRALAGAHVILPGGSSVEGAMGYVDAARELAAQVRRGDLPEPDVCVVALGSGGTAAGLAAGFAAEGMATRVVGVCVVLPVWAVRLSVSALARACARRCAFSPDANLADEPPSGASPRGGQSGSRARWRTRAPPSRPRLVVDARFVGRGYGFATADAQRASAEAFLAADLTLDPTYTGKAFAAALWYVRARQATRVLFWHTLSGASMVPLLADAPAEDAISPALRAMLRDADEPSTRASCS